MVSLVLFWQTRNGRNKKETTDDAPAHRGLRTSTPSASFTYTGAKLALSAARETEKVSFTTEVASGVDNSFEFNVTGLSGAGEEGVLVTVVEKIDNIDYVIGGGRIGSGAKQKVSFKSSINNVSVWFTGPYATLELAQVCTQHPVSVQHTYLVDVCDEDKDRYRFGFNGMEKDNELKGVGNSLDFGARMYDSRLGRWLSLDPLAAKYSSLNPYNFVANSPIGFIDVDGREIWIGYYNKKSKETVERLQYKSGKLYTKEGKEVTAANGYINDIKNRLDNIKELSISVGAMVNDLESQSQIHNISNYDRLYTTEENRNRKFRNGSEGTHTTFNIEKIMSISTPEATLAHELKHAYDRSKNQLNANIVKGRGFVEAEWDAINVQNQILHNQGKELRMDYDGVQIPDDKFIAPSDNDKPNKPQEPYPIKTEIIMNGNSTETKKTMSNGSTNYQIQNK